MKPTPEQILSDCIAPIKSAVKCKREREALYSAIIPVFIEAGLTSLGECFGQDEVFDELIEEGRNYEN